MRAKTKEYLVRLKQILQENQYVRTKDITKIFKLSNGSACRMIRLLRESDVGVLLTKNGYILSELAKKKDDVDYLHRLLGRRASDFIGLKAAQDDIRHRWNTVEDRSTLQSILLPLTSSARSLSGGMKALVQKSEKLGI